LSPNEENPGADGITRSIRKYEQIKYNKMSLHPEVNKKDI
jgi:hypothetical protein